jgi:AAA15 family ATPase/GTPase
MNGLITDILIPNKQYKFLNRENKSEQAISGLSKVNIFVGENNSGKSRFLRSILSEKDLCYAIDKEFIVDILNKFNQYVQYFKNYWTRGGKNLVPNEEMEKALQAIKFKDCINNSTTLHKIVDYRDLLQKLSEDTTGRN